MQRLTGRDEHGNANYPYCFREDTCGGMGASGKCDICVSTDAVCGKLAEYEDLEESVFNMFNGQITVKKIIESFVAFHELHQQGTEVAECVLLVNDEVRQYREWKQAAEQKGE